MTLEQFSNKLYESKILHDYKDGKIDYRKVHDWIVNQEEAITVTRCCKSDSEQLLAVAKYVYWNYDESSSKKPEDYLKDFSSQ